MAADLAVDKVPASLRKAAERLVKGAKWSAATATRDDAGELFDLLGEDADGHTLSVEGTAAGTVTAVERGLEYKDLPAAVSATVGKRFPRLKPEGVLAVYKGDDIRDLAAAELSYQINGEGAKGKDLTVEVSAAGKVLETRREVELADVPRAVTDALKAKAPRFQVAMVHRMTRENNEVVGFLFAGKGKRTAFVSADGGNVELHKDD